MGLINLEPSLEDGEQERWRRPAAHCLPDRTITGTLHLTSHGLLFMPNRLNRPTHRVQLRIRAGGIRSVGVAPPVRSLASRRNGGMRPRLRVMIDGLEPELFLINHPDRVVAQLRNAFGLLPAGGVDLPAGD